MNSKVLLLPFRPTGSGMSTYSNYLAKALDVNNAEVTILGFGDMPQTLESCENICYVNIGKDPHLLDWAGGIATTYWYIRRRLDRIIHNTTKPFDIIHFIYPEATIRAKVRSAKVVSTSWGFSTPKEIITDSRRKFSGVWQGLGMMTELQFYYSDLVGLRKSNGVICTTREGERFWGPRVKSPTVYLPSPVELPAQTTPQTNSQGRADIVTFLFAERELERPRNNLWIIFRALQLLRSEDFTKFQIHFVGGHSSRLRSYISRLESSGLQLYLHSYLSRDEFLNLLGTIDVCLMPRYVKDQGGYLALEAMARGIAIIASDMAAFRDLIVHGKNGLLIDPFNPRDLLANMRLVFDDRKELEKMRTEARRFIQDFHSLEKVGREHLAFYERVGAS